MLEYWEIIKGVFNPEYIISHGGLLFVLLVVFVESGLFFGFFLPGDSLLFTAGLLSATKILPEPFSIIISSIFFTAVIGNIVGYYFGMKAGENLYDKKDSIFFRKAHLITAEQFFEKYGSKTLVIARFLPIVRTFAPIFAGISRMDFKQFILANIIGAGLWVGILVNAGYFIGTTFPEAQNYLHFIILGLVILTAIPVITAYFKARKKLEKNSNL